MRVPSFLVRRFYVEGSLRNTESGFRLEAHNDMGEGTIVGLTRITVDGVTIDPERITAKLHDAGTDALPAAAISRSASVPVRRGDRVTIHVSGAPLPAGRHQLEVELVERDLGALELAISESVTDDTDPAAPIDC